MYTHISVFLHNDDFYSIIPVKNKNMLPSIHTEYGKLAMIGIIMDML